MTWDTYFYNLCKTVASKSPCMSRKIGALLVRDNSIISTGYNGPPRNIPHCGEARMLNDKVLKRLCTTYSTHHNDWNAKCPRKILGHPSGTFLELCPAQHAEENAVSNAARNGVSILGTTLYMNSVIPCQKCFGTLINAGVIEIVVEELINYDDYSKFLISNSSIIIRKFKL